MNKTARKSKGKRFFPYEHLYVYHIEGVVSEKDEPKLGKSFIGNWVEDNFSFLFFPELSSETVKDFLRDRSSFKLMDEYFFTYEDWQGGGLEAVSIDKFIITPPWDRKEVPEGKIKIIMDPGVVFGTGLHPTTRDCLKAISLSSREYPPGRVLDLGTGTGILALSAAYLGAKEVIAVDLNPLCVKTAKNNVHLNGCDDLIKVFSGKAEDFLTETADLILANMHYEAITGFLEKRRMSKGDRFVFSGLMRSQVRDLRDRVTKQGMKPLYDWDHDMTWYTVLAEKE